MTLPKAIEPYIEQADFRMDGIGMSASKVMIFSDKVLKITPFSPDSRNEAEMLSWLYGKLPVPEIICREVQDGKDYLLMTKLPGVMACHEVYMNDPAQQVRLLAEAIKMLWSVKAEGCPCNQSINEKLKLARYNVEHGLVDTEHVEPGTFGPGGFESPADLLQWLEEHKPQEELVLSHGDLCLPNVFFENGRVSGFLDLAHTGVGDKWQDIALCLRSLRHNHNGVYDGRIYGGFDEADFFRRLGLEPDWEKIRYYLLLDELF